VLVGVLISIMISIVVGVNLVPSIVESINIAKNTPNAPTGMSGLLDVLVYVNKKASLRSNFQMRTSQIRGKLNLIKHANPELNSTRVDKCVETRWLASLGMMV